MAAMMIVHMFVGKRFVQFGQMHNDAGEHKHACACCSAETSAQLTRNLNTPELVFPAKAGIQFCLVISNA
jgi:hypothetical protein